MKTLSGLDATFLYLETPETPMHVGSLQLYELPDGFKGSFHKAVQAHLARRVHLAPIFSRRLAFMPLSMGHPSWVDAGEVDLNFHVPKAVNSPCARSKPRLRGCTGSRSTAADRCGNSPFLIA
jgi:diacylglycerol O-acyltransferase / wax synthase